MFKWGSLVKIPESMLVILRNKHNMTLLTHVSNWRSIVLKMIAATAAWSVSKQRCCFRKEERALLVLYSVWSSLSQNVLHQRVFRRQTLVQLSKLSRCRAQQIVWTRQKKVSTELMGDWSKDVSVIGLFQPHLRYNTFCESSGIFIFYYVTAISKPAHLSVYYLTKLGVTYRKLFHSSFQYIQYEIYIIRNIDKLKPKLIIHNYTDVLIYQMVSMLD